jgi:hypothetical protein
VTDYLGAATKAQRQRARVEKAEAKRLKREARRRARREAQKDDDPGVLVPRSNACST